MQIGAGARQVGHLEEAGIGFNGTAWRPCVHGVSHARLPGHAARADRRQMHTAAASAVRVSSRHSRLCGSVTPSRTMVKWDCSRPLSSSSSAASPRLAGISPLATPGDYAPGHAVGAALSLGIGATPAARLVNNWRVACHGDRHRTKGVDACAPWFERQRNGMYPGQSIDRASPRPIRLCRHITTRPSNLHPGPPPATGSWPAAHLHAQAPPFGGSRLRGGGDDAWPVRPLSSRSPLVASSAGLSPVRFGAALPDSAVVRFSGARPGRRALPLVVIAVTPARPAAPDGPSTFSAKARSRSW